MGLLASLLEIRLSFFQESELAGCDVIGFQKIKFGPRKLSTKSNFLATKSSILLAKFRKTQRKTQFQNETAKFLCKKFLILNTKKESNGFVHRVPLKSLEFHGKKLQYLQ
jgi:hypothetical protein